MTLTIGQGTLTIDGGKLFFIEATTSSVNITTELIEDDTKLFDSQTKDVWALGTTLFASALKKAIEEKTNAPLTLAATFEDGILIQKFLDTARQSHQEEKWLPL